MKKYLACLGAAVLAALNSAFASDYYWTGAGGDTLWSNVGNWGLDTNTVEDADPVVVPATSLPTAADYTNFQDNQLGASLKGRDVTVTLASSSETPLAANLHSCLGSGKRVIISGNNVTNSVVLPYESRSYGPRVANQSGITVTGEGNNFTIATEADYGNGQYQVVAYPAELRAENGATFTAKRLNPSDNGGVKFSADGAGSRLDVGFYRSAYNTSKKTYTYHSWNSDSDKLDICATNGGAVSVDYS